MKTTRTFAWTCLAAAIGLTITSRALAGDSGLKHLIAVAQLQADNANDEAPPPPPPPPKQIVGTLGEGTFTSKLDGSTGAIRMGIDQQLLPYIEQDNLRGTIIDASVDRDGTMTFTAYDEATKHLLVIDATPVAWDRTGEIAKLRGDYQILRLDSRGTMRPVDQGTLGIIAILIGQ